ncbi:hypothetical protein MRB53_004403 [Persea americana]|uniref:Uncharacterized protein n=1 Tax=Persea americana TaxID=3435 RepID=A0ACC2MAG9_PERAE|nr:hypothetical protein MRB53_004403 [Persea americana]
MCVKSTDLGPRSHRQKRQGAKNRFMCKLITGEGCLHAAVVAGRSRPLPSKFACRWRRRSKALQCPQLCCRNIAYRGKEKKSWAKSGPDLGQFGSSPARPVGPDLISSALH